MTDPENLHHQTEVKTGAASSGEIVPEDE